MNTNNGFRKGLKQPARCENLAHQLPKNVIKDFSTQFATVELMLMETMSAVPVASGGGGGGDGNSKLMALDSNASVGMKRLRSLEHTLSSDSSDSGGTSPRAGGGQALPKSPRAAVANLLATASKVGSKAKSMVKKANTEHLSIEVDDFLAWMGSGSFLSEQIQVSRGLQLQSRWRIPTAAVSY